MSIITRFVNAGWNVSIRHDKTKTVKLDVIRITVSTDEDSLEASGGTLSEAMEVLCLMNFAELSVSKQV